MSLARNQRRMQVTQGLGVFHRGRAGGITPGIVRAAHRSMYIPAAITVLAAVLRLFRLDVRSFWLDEVLTARVVRIQSFTGLLSTVRSHPDQMPMYYLLAWALRGAGGSEWSLRLPAAIAGTLSVVAVYALARAIYRPRIAWIATLLMAILPFSVWYGQEARAYSLLMLLSTLQMLTAFHVVTSRRQRDWIEFSLVSVLNLYTHYVALALTSVAFLYIGRRAAVSLRGRALARQSVCGLLSLSVILLAYSPWIPELHAFLVDKSSGFARLSGGEFSWSRLSDWVATFDLQWIVLVLFIFGIYGAIRQLNNIPSRPATELILLWLVAPVAGFTFQARGALLSVAPRYLAFIYPDSVFLIAVGVDVAAVHLVHRMHWSKFRAYGVLLLLILLQAIPSLALSYLQPKDDYRAAARLIARASNPGSVVLGIGGGADFAAISLQYYFWRDRAAITAVSGDQVDARVAKHLGGQHRSVWGAVFIGDHRPYFQHALPQGFQTLRFAGLTIIRNNLQSRSSLAAAQELLHWGARFDPQMQAGADLLRVLGSHSRLGADLLSPVRGASTVAHDGRWWLTPGSRISADGRGFALTPSGTTNVVQSTGRVATGRTYLVSFTYRNLDLHGEQRVFVVADGPHRQPLAVYPTGAGYLCSPGRDWTRALFAVRGPSGVSRVSLWLRATGTGSASVRDIQIRRVQ